MTGPAVNSVPAETPIARSARRLWGRIAAALLATVALVWAGAGWRARVASAQVRSLAILPFTDLTQQNQNWFAASFAGEIIDYLDRVPGLQIIGRNSAFRIKGDS